MEFLSDIYNSVIEFLETILPTSPFTDVIAELEELPYLGYLNWFVPVGPILAVGSLWLAAITLFYFYSVAMRWIKLIGD